MRDLGLRAAEADQPLRNGCGWAGLGRGARLQLVRLEQLQNQGRLGDFPPTLVFSSAVDATVSVSALIDGLMMKLVLGATCGGEKEVWSVRSPCSKQRLQSFAAKR